MRRVSCLGIPFVVVLATCVANTSPAEDSLRKAEVRGQILFNKRGCRNCHALDGSDDRAIGPSLGNRKEPLTRMKALESIVHPSKDIRKGFESVVVVTGEGRVLSGRITDESGASLTLATVKENVVKSVSIPTDNIDEIVEMKTSVMPTDLLNGLTSAEIRDLLQYLASTGLVDATSKISDEEIRHQLHSAHAHHSSASADYGEIDDRPVFETVDHEIVIEVVPRQMRYSVELFDVKPGARVKLTLQNEDEMQHNLFLCQRGAAKWLDVARAAWALGTDGPMKRYTPESDAILQYTRLVDPDSSDTIHFTAPDEEGVYPYVCTIPGHAFLMRGEMHVMRESRGLNDVTWRYFEGNWDRLPDFEKMTPMRSGEISDDGLLSLEPLSHSTDHFGAVYDGTLNTAIAGSYRFYLDTDDGSRVLIDGQTVVEHDGVHSDGTVKSASVDLTAGSHEFQLQFFEKQGGEVLLAGWSGPGFKFLPLAGGQRALVRLQDGGSFHLKPDEEPRVVRVRLPDSSPRSIAVGLIGDVHCCFDATSCYVRYGWTGEFLDVGPDRGHGHSRGGGTAQPLGKRFDISSEFPIRIGDVEVPAAEFLGYRRSLLGPTFRYRIGGIEVSQTIEASRSSRGLRMTYHLDPPPNLDLTWAPSFEGLELKSSVGRWSGRVLTVPAADAGEFVISVEGPE